MKIKNLKYYTKICIYIISIPIHLCISINTYGYIFPPNIKYSENFYFIFNKTIELIFSKNIETKCINISNKINLFKQYIFNYITRGVDNIITKPFKGNLL